MQTENKVSNAIATLYENEMTDDGLAELKQRFPADVIIDMTDENELKKARKVRTEMNKLVEAITARRINVSADIKSKGDMLIIEVTKAFSPVVVPFEKQLIINKAVKEEKERKLRLLLDKQRIDIRNINDFISDCIGKDSKYISGSIDAVDGIDTSKFHKEIIHEAIETKENVLNRLTELLTQSIAEEALQEERKKLEVQQEKIKLAELKIKAQERLNTLMLIPTTMFGKTSVEIKEKIHSINHYPIVESQFGELYQTALNSAKTVVSQLGDMYEQLLLVEKAKEAEALDKQQQEPTEQNKAFDNMVGTGQVFVDCNGKSVDQEELNKPISKTGNDIVDNTSELNEILNSEKPVSERLGERFKDVEQEKPEPTLNDVEQFIFSALNNKNPRHEHFMECFGYLFICKDSILIKEAVNKLRSEFKEFFSNK